MADQMINQLPVTTAPKTGDKLLVIGAAEEELIDYDKLADAILNKLTSKAFTLDQGNMSLVAALNALNSNLNSVIIPEYHNKFWKYNDGCKDRASSIPSAVVCIGKIVLLYLYFNIENEEGTKTIGTLDESIKPRDFTTVVAASFKGQGYPLLIHPRTYNLYSDVLLPTGTYCVQAVWVKS